MRMAVPSGAVIRYFFEMILDKSNNCLYSNNRTSVRILRK